MSAIPDLPALSIRQPWAWLILHAGKNIENRSRRSHYRGWFLIHASKGMTSDEYIGARDFLLSIGRLCQSELPHFESPEFQRGGIVGMAKLGNCVSRSDSTWFVGEWGYVLDEVRPLPFTPCKGALGFFRPKLE